VCCPVEEKVHVEKEAGVHMEEEEGAHMEEGEEEEEGGGGSYGGCNSCSVRSLPERCCRGSAMGF